MDFTVRSNTYTGLNTNLENSLWNVAIMNAPYRTGNLRSTIKKIPFSKNKVMFAYSQRQAYYTDFLENGIGRNKKHIGFIENKTVGSMVQEILTFAASNSISFSGIPVVRLRTDIARNYERKLLSKSGLNVNARVNAFDRAKMSALMFDKTKRKSSRNRFEFSNYGFIKDPITENRY